MHEELLGKKSKERTYMKRGGHTFTKFTEQNGHQTG